jgi:hypothetical protein
MRIIFVRLLWTFDISVPDGVTLPGWTQKKISGFEKNNRGSFNLPKLSGRFLVGGFQILVSLMQNWG